jgi:hypothetical protein
MVWADRGTRIEYDSLRLDLARGIQDKLQKTQVNKASELQGAQFPRDRNPDALYAFQENNPGYEAQPMTSIAPRLGVTRLIYVEVQNFQLHSEQVLELFRGSITATVQVIEVTGGTAKVGYTDTVSAVYPANAPEEGLPNLGERKTYQGTLDAFTTAVTQRFVEYEEPR